MKLTLNDKEITADTGASLADILKLNNISPKGIAVAVNETVVPAAKHDSFTLTEGDDIIIIKAFYGG